MIEFKINNGALESCKTDDKVVVIPEDVNCIKRSAFINQVTIEELIMGDNVSVIEESTFEGCINLKRVKLSKKIETLGQYAFKNCNCLKKINLNNIKYSGSMLLDSIDNILNASYNNGDVNSLREYRFYDLIKKIKTIVNSRIGFKKITFDINIDDNISSKLYGDDEKIQKVLLNVFNNAVKYTEVGKINLSVSATVENDIQRLQFKISDTGCGIKDSEKSFIFSSNGTDKNSAGLALSKNYIELIKL